LLNSTCALFKVFYVKFVAFFYPDEVIKRGKQIKTDSRTLMRKDILGS